MSTRATYRCHVRVGDQAWTVTSDDAPDYGPTLPLSFGWDVPDGSPGFPCQPNPATASFGIVAPDSTAVAGIDLGSPVWVRFWTDTAGTGDPLAEFTGRVAELGAEPVDLGVLYQVQAVDYTVDLADLQVGAADWPDEAFSTRLTRILDEAGWTHPFPITATSYVDGVESFAGAKDAGYVSARQELVALVNDTPSYYAPGVQYALEHWIMVVRTSTDTGEPLVANQVDFSAVRQVGSRPLRFTTAGALGAGLDHPDAVDADTVPVDVSWVRTKATECDSILITHRNTDVRSATSRLLWPGPPTPPPGRVHPYRNSTTYGPLLFWIEKSDMATDDTVARWQVDGIRVELWAAYAADPDAKVGEGWWTIPTAMTHTIGVVSVNPAFSPTDAVAETGALAGARLVIPPGGEFYADLQLRNRAFPPADGEGADDGLTFDWLSANHPDLSLDDMEPITRFRDFDVIGRDA